MKLTTRQGHGLPEVVSALQKSIRRADARLAGYLAIEMFESNYREYVWRRLLTISAEDCWGIITQEIWALYQSWRTIDQAKKGKGAGRIFVAKAAILLAQARKCRDADHLTNLVYDGKSGVDDAAVEQLLAEAAADGGPPPELPDYTYDCHTGEGKRRGKTKRDFFVEEFAALQPRQAGLFDDDVRKLK
jgi:replication-associated recombination protein RarA